MAKEMIKLETKELSGVEKSKAEQIKETFEPMAEMLQKFEDRYNDIIKKAAEGITEAITKDAKKIRLAIAKVRIETEKRRRAQKEEYLRAGKAIDGISNILKWAVKEKEDKLQQIEKHFELQEQKRLEALQQERAEKLSEYVEDAHERKLSEMEPDVWAAYFTAKKREFEDRKEAEKQAELARIEKEKEEAEEREKIRLENEKLKKEAEEREKRAKEEAEERAKEEAERKAKEEAERKAREEKERIEKEKHEAELRKMREEQERIKKEEAEKIARIQAELKAKEEAERKAAEEAEARKQAELNRGDADKIKALIANLESLKSDYSFKSAKNNKMFLNVCGLIDKVINYIAEKRG